MSYKYTERFTEPDDERLSELRRQFGQLERFGFSPGWASHLLRDYPIELTKLAVIQESLSDSQATTTDSNASGLAELFERLQKQKEEYAKHKWIGALELREVSAELTKAILTELKGLTTSEIRDYWDETPVIRNNFESVDEFQRHISKLTDSTKFLTEERPEIAESIELGTYEVPPEVGESRQVEYFEAPSVETGIYDLTRVDMQVFEGRVRRVGNGEVLGFIEPESTADKIFGHPPAHVKIDGQEYIVPPGFVHPPEEVEPSDSMSVEERFEQQEAERNESDEDADSTDENSSDSSNQGREFDTDGKDYWR